MLFQNKSDSGKSPFNLAQLLGIDDKDESAADQFASWLPYGAYLPDQKLFPNRDGIGFMLEVMPQSGADDRMVEVLISIYSTFPAGTGIQFHLFGSPHIRNTLRAYANMRMEDGDQLDKSSKWGRPARNDNAYRSIARRRFEYLTRGSQHSLTSGFHYSMRDYRLMVSVSVPGDPEDLALCERIAQMRDSLSSTLTSASLPNIVCDAADLINWCALFVNPDRLTNSSAPELHYDDGREIRDQIVDHDTIQDARANGILLWKEGDDRSLEARFFSIKSFPERFGLWQMGSLIGDLTQPQLQYPSPFLLTMGVHILDGNATKSAVTANHVRATQNASSAMAKVMPDVNRKATDWGAAASVIDAGGVLVSMYHQLALFTSPENVVNAQEAARAIWRTRGFELNADTYQHRQALIASLPMTLSPKFHGDLKKMRRVTRKTGGNAVHMAPVVAEWRGTRTPTLLFGGRRGQVMTVDVYDNNLGNYNFAIIGAPGSGKSVLMNEMAWSYLSVGAKVWMLDLGRSFEKLCKKANGTYIEFKPDARINLNPFSMVTPRRIGADGQWEGGIEEDIDMLKPALAKMASMSKPLEEVQLKALSAMTLKVYREYGADTTVTALRDAFKGGNLPDLDIKGDQRLKDLAVMLNPYSRGGEYERFFDGPNSIDWSNDFMVIENEELKRKPELHAVVNILLMFQITGQMYLTRDRKKLLFIDELKQQLGEIGSDDPIKAAVVEEAARRARKYGGALGTATQSANDYYGSAQMMAALECSDWTFLLRQKAESIELLGRNGRISMDEGKKRLLQSMRTEPGVFSECHISSPIGEGIGRIILDPHSALLFSNSIDDNKPLDDLRATGLSLDDAITELLRRRGRLP